MPQPTESRILNFCIRDAVPTDASEVLAIYSPFITHSVTTLEFDVPSEEEIQQRIKNVQSHFPWLICETEDGTVAGYAYASKHRDREGYQWVAEIGIYVSSEFRGQGVGKILYEKLFEILKRQGYFHALAIISGSNIGSIEFHEKLGFSFVGRWKNYGNKFGKWHDVSWYSKDLQEIRDDPHKPVPYSQVKYLISLS